MATEVPLADAIWRLHLPSGYEAVGAGGTMTAEDLPRPPLAAAEVVGWLAGVNDALSHLSLPGGCSRSYSAREAARHLASSNNLKQLGLADRNYVHAQGGFPPGTVATVDSAKLHAAIAQKEQQIRERRQELRNLATEVGSVDPEAVAAPADAIHFFPFERHGKPGGRHARQVREICGPNWRPTRNCSRRWTKWRSRPPTSTC